MKLVSIARKYEALLTVAIVFEAPVLRDVAARSQRIIPDPDNVTVPLSLLSELPNLRAPSQPRNSKIILKLQPLMATFLATRVLEALCVSVVE
jgi:hypothetical protein